MPDSFLCKKSVVATIVIVIVALMGIFLFMASEGNREPVGTLLQSQNASVPMADIGTLGAKCGGRDRLPCAPGLLCNTPPGQFANTEGVCVKDNAPTAVVANEGEECDGWNIICHPGYTCQKNGGDKGICINTAGTKAFIYSLIPNGAELDNGIYKAPVGTKLHMTVEAVNVEEGSLYYLPMTSSKSGPDETDKVAPLTAIKDKQNSYEAYFTVQKNTLGQLFAKMKGKDGQIVSIPVTVGAK